MNKSKIDFHLHTVWSDGEDTTKELLENVKNSGVKFFSITDHDTIKGNIDFCKEENFTLLKESGIKYFTGIEISSCFENKKIHILGIDYDLESAEIKKVAQMGEDMRKRKTLYRIDSLKNDLGIELSQESKKYLLSLNVCAKPHFARCFVNDGYAENIIEAMKGLTGKLPNVPCFIDSDIAIKAILESKGIPIWAHPLGGIHEKRLSKTKFLHILDGLMKQGLKGIECYYSLYSKEEIEFLVQTAKEKNLIISAGSDYHGKNVKEVQIGEVSSE
ncbi:MAG: PHP domain-containing protein [Clostridia bacterium]|nr:PHP domain-containing protein [Clostridia bacterium]